MAIVVIILLILFGVAPFGEPAVTVSEPAVSAQPATVAPPLLTTSGPATGLAVDPATGEATYAGAGDALLRADGDGAWEPVGTSPDLAAMAVDSRNPDRIWAGTGMECFRGGGVSVALMRSDDAGASWVEAGPAGYVPLAAWDPGDIVIAHECSGLKVSRDGGATWAMPEGLPLGSQVTSFAVLSSPESAAGLAVLVGVTGEGGTSELYRVDLADPAAATVEGPLATWYAHAGLDVDATGAILLGAPQGVLRSDDGGVTWTTIRTGLESTTLEQDPIEVFPTDLEPGSFGLPALVATDGGSYVAGVDGVYRLSEAGDAWERLAETDVEITGLATEPGTGALLIQTAEAEVLRVEVKSAGT